MGKGYRGSEGRESGFWLGGRLVAGVVGVAGADGQGSVNLFGGDYGGELVGEGDAAEGEGAVGSGEGSGRPTVGGTDGKDKVLGAGVLESAQGGGEIFGGELLAAAIGEEEDGPGAGGGFVDEGEEGLPR